MQQFGKRYHSLKWLILAIAGLSVFSPIASYIFMRFNITPPNIWLPLSGYGVSHGWLWEFVTSFFLHSDGIKITLSFLVSLCIALFLLWFCGKQVIEVFGEARFLSLFFSSGIFASLMAFGWLTMLNSSHSVFGLGPPLLASLIVWLMLYPDLRFHYFHFVRFEAKWLIYGLIAIVILFNAVSNGFAHLIYNVAGVIWGYLFGLIVLKLPALFKIRNEKIIDIRDYENDEDFMERMLTKITRGGLDTLTPKERKRMDEISKRRK